MTKTVCGAGGAVCSRVQGEIYFLSFFFSGGVRTYSVYGHGFGDDGSLGRLPDFKRECIDADGQSDPRK